MRWPFRDKRPAWVRGPGYRVVIPEEATDAEVLALWAVVYRAIVREKSQYHYETFVPLNVWMPDEEYEVLDVRIKKFLVKR